MDVKGRDLISGLPRTIQITAEETRDALLEPVMQVVGCIKSVLERTPPELASDVADKGMVLTGGGALLNGLDRLLSEETGMPTHLVDDMLSCVALGTGKAFDSLHKLKDNLIYQKKTGAGR
jgi:rod shape-determining protein MreB